MRLKSAISISKRDDEHPCRFHKEVPWGSGGRGSAQKPNFKTISVISVSQGDKGVMRVMYDFKLKLARDT